MLVLSYFSFLLGKSEEYTVIQEIQLDVEVIERVSRNAHIAIEDPQLWMQVTGYAQNADLRSESTGERGW